MWRRFHGCVLAGLLVRGHAASLDCSQSDPSGSGGLAVCCDAQRAWADMEAHGGCGGQGASAEQCSTASSLCRQCRLAAAGQAEERGSDESSESGASEGEQFSSLDVGFLEVHCVLPQWKASCQGPVADLGFGVLLGAGALLLLLAMGGLVLFDWQALPRLLARAGAQTLPFKERQLQSPSPSADNLGQPHLERCTIGVSDALRLAAAIPDVGPKVEAPRRHGGMILVWATRRVFLGMASAAVVLRMVMIAAYLTLLPGQRQVLEALPELLLCLLPLLWCAFTSRPASWDNGVPLELAFWGPGRRCPRFTTYAVLTVGTELYSTLVLSYSVATAQCELAAWKPVMFYCIGVLVTVMRCYSAVLALRLQDAVAGACRRVLPKAEDAFEPEPLAEGEIDFNIQDEDGSCASSSSFRQAPPDRTRRWCCWRSASSSLAWSKEGRVEKGQEHPDVACSCLPSRCCPALRQKLAGRRVLLRVGLLLALVSAVASAVIVRAVVGEVPAPVLPSSCGVARNSTTTCVPWRLAGTHLVDQKTGDLLMDLANTFEDCCEGCDATADCQAWIFERMAKRCRWIQFDDEVCRKNPGDLGCRCYTNVGTAYGFKPTSNLVWLTAT